MIKIIKRILLGIFIFFAAIMVMGLYFGNKDQGTSAQQAAQQAPAKEPEPTTSTVPATPVAQAEEPKPVAPSGPKWSYSERKDEMTDQTHYMAILTSVNSLDFKFPYAGNNHGRIAIRRQGKDQDVIFSISKGQIPCTTGCSITVRFDDGKPVPYRASPPESRDSTLIFLDHPELFIALAETANKIRVQATYFQEGSPVLTFETSERLVWPRQQRKK